MACSSCNRNNRRSNDWGCRKAVQSARWPSYNGGSCGNGRCGCGCPNPCGCGQSGCASCAGCNQNICTKCGSATICTGSSPVYAQPYEGNYSAWSRSGGGCGSGRCASSRYGYDRCGASMNNCFPFYCGPCGPVEPVCGCSGGCGSSCANGCDCADNCGCMNPCLCREPVYGFFTQVGTLDVNSGGVIPFNGGSTVEGIWKDGGELTLDTAGVYMVTLSADVPENVTLYTELDVRVNGVTNPGGRLILDKEYADAPLMANTQTVITVNEGAVVTVTSSEGVAFSTGSASQPIVTLSIVKLS